METEKYNWRDDDELVVLLSDSAKTPKAVTGPKFDTQYKFLIRRTRMVELKEFVPEWALSVVKNMLDNDPDVAWYSYEIQYPYKKKAKS